MTVASILSRVVPILVVLLCILGDLSCAHGNVMPGKIDSVLQIDVDADTGPLKDGNPGNIRLLLTNIATTPVVIDGVKEFPLDPFTIGAPTTPIVIAPGQQQVVDMTVTPTQSAKVGDHTITLTVLAHWKTNGVNYSGVSVVQESVTLGIGVVTGVLGVLGIPALDLAPGFLLLGAFGLLRRLKVMWFTPAADGFVVTDTDVWNILSAKEPDFWIVAVLLSMGLDTVPTAIWPGLFLTYSMLTMVEIYLTCIALGSILYCGWRVICNKAYKSKEDDYASKAIMADDGPIDVIKKIGKKQADAAKQGVKEGSLLARHVGRLDPTLSDCFVVDTRPDGTSVIVPAIRLGQPISDSVLSQASAIINRDDAQALEKLLIQDNGSDIGGLTFVGGSGKVKIKKLPHDPSGPSLRFVTL